MKKEKKGQLSISRDLRENCFPLDSFRWKQLLKLATGVSRNLAYVLFCTRIMGSRLVEQGGQQVIRPVLQGKCKSPCNDQNKEGGCAFVDQAHYDAWKKEHLAPYKNEIMRLLKQI